VIRIIGRTTDPVLARYMPRWAVAVWAANNVTGNRFWHLLPHRLRSRWAHEWTVAYMRWKAAGYPPFDAALSDDREAGR
jgi:hypothetical protein